MTGKHRFILILILNFLTCSVAQNIKVDKVEPPNWWSGMKYNQVQLMIYGENLEIQSAEFSDPRISVKKVHSILNQSYLFIDIAIPSNLPSGEYKLILKGKGSEITISYPILEREKPNGRNMGFDASDVIYLITPDRFVNGNELNDKVSGYNDETDRSHPYKRHGGDIEGIISKLDYLKDLGITALWINPLTENNMRFSYHGYAVTDMYTIDPRFGSNKLYKKLVTEAHKRDIKIILDHVSNHIGINHLWMKNLPMDDWINGSIKNHQISIHNKANLLDVHTDSDTRSTMLNGWFSDGMPDLNQKNPFVANYIIQNTIWWMEQTGLDGIREDTYPYPDQQFLAQWAKIILEEYPQSNIVGEVWDERPAILAWYLNESPFQREFQSNLPVITDFAISSAYYKYVTGEHGLEAIRDVINQDFVYNDAQNLFTFLDNHDIPRVALGAGGITPKMKIVLNLILTTRGIPQIYYGTEIGMIGGEDHGRIREDFPGGFKGDNRNAFTPEGRTKEENQLFDEIKQLLFLRKKYPALALGKMTHFPVIDEMYAYLKSNNAQKILVLVNGNESERKVNVPVAEKYLKNVKSIIDLKSGTKIDVTQNKNLILGPMQVGLYLIEEE